MIQQENKIITVHTDNMGKELCLRIDESESYSGILNLLWMNEKEVEKLIQELEKGRKRLMEKRQKIEEIKKTANFARMYEQFDYEYNPYPVQISRSEAFSKAYADGLIDRDTYYAAQEYYGNLWSYVGD